MTENYTLSNRHNAIHVGEGLELIFFVTTHHIVLLDIVQALLFLTQPNDDRVWYYCVGKFHHLVVVGCRKQDHLTVFRQSPGTEEIQYFSSPVFALQLKRGNNDNLPCVCHLPLEPVTLVSQWRILRIKKDNLPEWKSLPGTKRWVVRRKQTKGERAAKLFEANQTNAYAQGEHLLANRKSPSNYDY